MKTPTLLNPIPKPVIPPIDDHANKYSRGVCALAAGSEKMSGAAAFCALSCYAAGAGLVKIQYKPQTYPSLSVLCPECVFCDKDKLPEKATAFALGCGCRDDDCLFLLDYRTPTVIDADGITALSKHIDILERLNENTVITPHSGEMARLCGVTAKEIESDRVGYARRFCENYKGVLVLKGHNTIVAQGDKLTVDENPEKNLSTAGSGDVLCGIITGLLSRGMDAFDGAAAGVYIHSLAGKIAAQRYEFFTARELINCISQAFKSLG
ncbi:MAG: NAD(P)H-hydrate dehydratase [Oscillospiraceae bacterium]|nr:NAD(P)H-hydrate dehydratase [Candidatus Equicaccousia limihippi]